MQKITFFAVALILFSTAAAQLKNTRWKTTLCVDNKPLNAIIDFKNDTVALYTVADSSNIERMTYTGDDTSFSMLKIDGQSDCDNNTPGRYGFIIKADSLFFRLLKDDCADRYAVFQDTRWGKWKTYPGITVEEPILKKYTGIYAHDDAHPITISLDHGILYAEGPNNGLPKSPFTPITATKFFLRIAGVEMDFVQDSTGRTVKLISHEQKDYELKKIK